MSIIVLCSATGAPGVTSTALGLTLAWPGSAFLVDADRSGGQAILAGYLGGIESQGRGIVSLVAAHRERCSENPQTHGVALDASSDHVFLPGFATPAAATAFERTWPEFAYALTTLSAQGHDVIIDAGRLGTGLPRQLLDVASVVLLVLRSSLRSVAAARLAIPLLTDARESGLVLVGPGAPYSGDEIAATLAHDVWITVPHDAETARFFSDGEPRRHCDKSALWKSYQDGASSIVARLQAQHQLVRRSA
ncbi:MAG: hypothetical protein ACRCWS_01350 [Propionibacteriaceae bacterium]